MIGMLKEGSLIPVLRLHPVAATMGVIAVAWLLYEVSAPAGTTQFSKGFLERRVEALQRAGCTEAGTVMYKPRLLVLPSRLMRRFECPKGAIEYVPVVDASGAADRRFAR